MTDTSKQLRGHCQCCGRQHAVGRGYVAQHGYTVKNGWFEGVCPGNQFAPMETKRDTTDKVVADVRAKVAKLREQAGRFESGKSHPEGVEKSNPAYRLDRSEPRTITVKWADLKSYQQDEELRHAVLILRNQAKGLESFADDLEKLADACHGKPLIEVTKPAAAAPILCGERRKLESGAVCTVIRQQGARVYWKNERGFNGWTGTQAWRKLEKVEG